MRLFRLSTLGLTALVVLAPVALILYQSFLSDPFFAPRVHFTLSAYEFILDDEDFWEALRVSALLAGLMAAIAVPLGVILAFLLTRTNIPGRKFLEPLVLVPIFMSSVVLAFGYVVTLGPVGFVSVIAKQIFGTVPWNIYSIPAIGIVAGLTHVPHVYLYAAAALRNLGSDLEEAARISGASPWQVARSVSLPMIMPVVLYAAVLIFFLGFELFGLPLVLGDPQGVLVMATYLYKLTNKLGVPSYQLMAVVVVAIIIIAIPLILLQRWLLRHAARYVSVRGKASRHQPINLGPWRWAALGVVLLWFTATVVVPVAGILLRSLVSSWGEGVNLLTVLTLDHFRELFEHPNVARAIINTLLLAAVGGAAAVAAYGAVAIAMHRWPSPLARLVDAVAMIPRAMPGIVAGLAMLWIFLFVKPLSPLRDTLVSVWLAYSVVWFAYGLRIISGTLMQLAPELEEAGRTVGATAGRVARDITLPLARHGLFAAWLLIFLIFAREYSTGVYLLGPGTEVIGSLMVSLWGTGAIDLVSALAVVNTVIIVAGLALALRFGVKLND
ncbi:ABC transporter permease [Elstera cyanobacteriorum]|uniref:Spermidine/putrescine ABC transporter permease n=1 Tax=Elstera cyanobacteriorum TaxID=2022747 RepID=A0A255XJQ1_9PROT|nr:iron ABC transporter permease [Elstera cyanobacteriorum]MCK6442782.1 iron ABC transporter permease [Elstera cyanobacteriorum]OYQ16665.1 spermidine/putrescine ABC transporter permease [Elstera cyanobacteriorum]GFZ87660.1 ABC transporter permease [Elstera cyanobacteriorum]